MSDVFLNVVPIFVPPLRERQEDIALLADHFMAIMAAEYGRRPKRLASEASARLQHYNWPGNVRELHNVIERATILARITQRTRSDIEKLFPQDVGAPDTKSPARLARSSFVSPRSGKNRSGSTPRQLA